jgi:hypothetical protein
MELVCRAVTKQQQTNKDNTLAVDELEIGLMSSSVAHAVGSGSLEEIAVNTTLVAVM